MATKKTAKKTAPAATSDSPTAAAPTAKKPAKKPGEVVTEVTAKKVTPPKLADKPSPDVIARAAYLNYRRRVEQGLPGDSHGDWLEAERYFSRTSES